MFTYHITTQVNIKEYYRLLNVSEECNQRELRDAFLSKARQYHPDSGHPSADAAMFARVEHAYRTLTERIKKETGEEEEVIEKDYGIKHTAPQHRQFLSYEGVGYGTVLQRQKQYNQYKVMKAVEAVHEHRIQKLAAENENALVLKDKQEAKKQKIRNAIDRLVEDLIQESMAKGDFDNLPGKGKPINTSTHNPYVDTVTHKLNEVLINNGFTPEWILLEKEIRQDKEDIRKKLTRQRWKLGLNPPLSDKETAQWQEALSALQTDVDALNSKLNKYNLLVPFLYKQRAGISLVLEARRVLELKDIQVDLTDDEVNKNELAKEEHSTETILSYFSKIF